MANYELGNLVWRVKGDTANFDKNIGGAQTRFEKFGASARKVGASLTKFVTLPLAALGGVAVKAASDLGESLNAVNVVFGDAADTVNAFGETAAEAAGLSQSAFNELATTIGSQLKQSGLDIDSVADQTIELTQRSADLASVFNVDVTESTRALGAALRGESEPARRFGVNISAAAVQASALASGLVESKDQITEQIKVQARYNLIMKQSEQVAGDFANTSDDVANQTRILKAQLVNVGAELGQTFIPIITDVASGVSDAVEWFSELDDGTKKLITTLGIIAAASGPIVGAIGMIGKLKTAIIAINTAALWGPVGIIVGLAAITTGLIAIGRARRESHLEELAEEFGDIKTAAGLAGEEIDSIQDKISLASGGFDDAAEAVDLIADDLGVSKQTVIDIGLETETVTDAYKEQLQALRDQLTEQATLNAYQDSWIANAVEQAAADARSAEILRQRREDAEAEAEAQAEMARIATAARAEAEDRYSLLLQEGQAQTRIQEIELERQQALDALADNYVRTGQAVDDLNEYYDTLISKEKELQAEREAADEEARLEAELQALREKNAETAAEQERLTALRIKLFGTEQQQFEAHLAEQLKLYKDAGLSKRELDEYATSERKRFHEEQLRDREQKVKDEVEAEEEAAEQVAAAWGVSIQERERLAKEGYAEFRRLRQEDLEEEREALREHLETIGGYVQDFANMALSIRIEGLEAEAEAVRRSADAELAALEERYQRELELAGLAEDTAVEAAQKKLAAAVESGDKEEIAAAKDALAKAQIDEDYAEKRKAIEKETALELWQIEVAQFEAKKKLDMIQAAITTAQMAIRAYNALVGIPGVGPILAPIAAAAAIGFGLAQQSLIASQPPPPKPAFAMGGDFITNGPQEILVGDNPGGRERVNVEPLGSEGGGKPMQILVMLDGRQIANSTVDYVNNGIVKIEANA